MRPAPVRDGWMQDAATGEEVTADVIDGHQIYGAGITRESLSGSRFVFGISHADGSAIYLADLASAFAVDVPALDPATLALLALALATAAVVLLRLRS